MFYSKRSNFSSSHFPARFHHSSTPSHLLLDNSHTEYVKYEKNECAGIGQFYTKTPKHIDFSFCMMNTRLSFLVFRGAKWTFPFQFNQFTKLFLFINCSRKGNICNELVRQSIDFFEENLFEPIWKIQMILIWKHKHFSCSHESTQNAPSSVPV